MVLDILQNKFSFRAVKSWVNIDLPFLQATLVRKYSYPCEIHRVYTEDGYILEMHRIPRGRAMNVDVYQDRPVVFLQHGLLSSSAEWVLMAPGNGFGKYSFQ